MSRSGIKREKQGQNLKGQRVHFTVQKGDGLKQAEKHWRETYYHL